MMIEQKQNTVEHELERVPEAGPSSMLKTWMGGEVRPYSFEDHT